MICFRENARSCCVSDAARSPARLISSTARVHRGFFIDLLQQELAVPRYHREQVIEVVRNATRQSTHRLHLLRLAELPLEFLTLLLGPLALADQAEYRHEIFQLRGIGGDREPILQRFNEHLEFLGFARDGHATIDIEQSWIGCADARDNLADPPSLDIFQTRQGPECLVDREINKIDRAAVLDDNLAVRNSLLHMLEQPAISPLALLQCLLCTLGLGDVVNDGEQQGPPPYFDVRGMDLNGSDLTVGQSVRKDEMVPFLVECPRTFAAISPSGSVLIWPIVMVRSTSSG